GLADAIGEAFRHRGFWLLNLGFFACGFQLAFIAAHLPAYLLDRGLSAKDGVAALAIIALANVVGTYACGVLGGIYRRKKLLAGIYLGRALAIALLASLPAARASTSSGRSWDWAGSAPRRSPTASSPRSSACATSRRCSASSSSATRSVPSRASGWARWCTRPAEATTRCGWPPSRSASSPRPCTGRSTIAPSSGTRRREPAHEAPGDACARPRSPPGRHRMPGVRRGAGPRRLPSREPRGRAPGARELLLLKPTLPGESEPRPGPAAVAGCPPQSVAPGSEKSLFSTAPGVASAP